jgi:hypothetical protein
MDTEAQQPIHAERPSRGRRRAALVAGAGLASLAIAVPVSGAFAEGDGSGGSDGGASGAYPAQPPQGQPPELPQGGPTLQGAPDRPCPEDQGGGDQSQGQGSDSSGTWQPAPSTAL